MKQRIPSISEFVSINEGKTIDLVKIIDTWLNDHQKAYIAFLESLFVGKNIKAKAVKYNGGGHSWKQYEIMNITKVISNGGKFYEEIIVIDSNDDWYTLSSTELIEYIK